MNFYLELLGYLFLSQLAVLSPGPDFLIVTQLSFKERKAGVLAAVGIGLGLILHNTYCLLGIPILQTYEYFLNIIKLIGALYLIYLAITSIFQVQKSKNKYFKDMHAFAIGFLTNVLNVKAMLWIITFYTTIISSNFPNKFRIMYAILSIIFAVTWFIILANIISIEKFKKFIAKYFKWLNYITAVFLFYFGIKIIIELLLKNN